MNRLRHIIRDHRLLACLLFAAALAMRVLVPAGFMPVASGGLAVEFCSGSGPVTMVMEFPGVPGKAEHKADSPCAFGALAAPGLAGADPIQLAIALALIALVALFWAAPVPVHRATHLRPPPQGPPLRT